MGENKVIFWNPTKPMRGFISFTLTICYWRLVWLQVQNWPGTRHTHQPHTRRVWAFLENNNNREREREAESVHGNQKQRVTSSVGIMSLNYMFTCRKLDGFDDITVFICANGIIEWMSPPREAVSKSVISFRSSQVVPTVHLLLYKSFIVIYPVRKAGYKSRSHEARQLQ